MDVGYKPHVPSLTSHYFAEMSATIHLCRGDRVLEISLRSYAAQQLARMFNVEQDTIWLKSRYKDGHVYFPNPDGVFDLLNDGVLPHAELIVEGEPRQGQASQPSCSGIYAQPSRSSAIVMDSTPPRYSPGSQFTSVTAHRGKRPLEEATYRLKIIQATMAFASPGNKKPTFECHGKAFFEITESNANVPALLVAVRTEFGEDYTIVTGDGLEVKDSFGTQG